MKSWTITVVVFALASSVYAQKPAVRAVFVFDRDVCPRMPNRAKVQNDLAGVVNRKLHEHYPFVNWNTVAPRGTPEFKVLMKMVGTPNGIAYHLGYLRSVGAFDGRMPKVRTGGELYDADSGASPCTDINLATKIAARVDTDLDQKKGDFEDDFFSNVVISTKVPEGVSTEGRIAFTTLRWDELQAAAGSTIRVIVKDRLHAELKPIDRHDLEDDPLPWTCAEVSDLTAQELKTPLHAWDDRIPNVLSNISALPAEVVFARYERDPDAAKRPPTHKAKKPRFVSTSE